MEIWQTFTIIGIVSFSIQGGMIAMENKYDLLAVYIFGILTSFGGGALRKVLIGGTDSELWNQGGLFYLSIISVTVVLLFPGSFLKSRKIWASFLDAIGAIAFAIQGSIVAVDLGLPASAIVVSALITAFGGGLIRDMLSQRKPILLGEEVYALWVLLVGLFIGNRWVTSNFQLLILFIVFTTLRILSILKGWKIPYRHYQEK